MSIKTKIGLAGPAIVATVLILAGCNRSISKQAKVRPPAPTPEPALTVVQESLPFPNRAIYLAPMQSSPRPALDVLIEQAQASLNAGQDEYKAGNVDTAREDFDRAEDLILNSGFQVDSDPQLAKLFDQIGEAMEAYQIDESSETEAAAPDQESETPAQPAPIDEIADMTLPPGDPRLALKAEQELIRVPHDLPLTVNDSVLQYLSFFCTPRGQSVAEHGLDRAGRYGAMIRRVLHQEGVPEDLIYLAQAESAFQPDAVSRAGARGIWQFMPYRGEEYDLDRTYWVDDRSDPEKATRAAARHMRDLYGMFGDWYLVMAAYNSGPLNVTKAVERTGYADFWQLQKLHALPKQTQNYVPIIIALALVAKDPNLYGVHIQADKAAPFDVVKPGHSIDLHLVADASGADLDDLQLLNPELLRNVTPNDANFELKVPAGDGDKFKQNVSQVPEDKWTSWRLHTVDEGETLGDVARHYRVTVAALENANHLETHATVPAGFVLDVPVAPVAIHLVRYRVQRGDTLAGIADRFDVTVAELKRWNHIRGNSAPRGWRLRIYAGTQGDVSTHRGGRTAESGKPVVQKASAADSDSSDARHHRVKPGETLYSIARTYKTTVDSIRQSNPFLSERTIEPGDLLNIER
ncbi:MAG: LysM peptidoglycan-binding domain-containing protein [Candidatus Acidiferrales bacterium]